MFEDLRNDPHKRGDKRYGRQRQRDQHEPVELFGKIFQRDEVVEFTIDPELLKEDKREHQKRDGQCLWVGDFPIVDEKEERDRYAAGKLADDIERRSVFADIDRKKSTDHNRDDIENSPERHLRPFMKYLL